QETLMPVYKKVDTCAGQFESTAKYFYSTYETENESVQSDKKKVLVLGSGPIRIGQGIEFDYATVHSVMSIQEMGYEDIIIYKTQNKRKSKPLSHIKRKYLC